jgi:hypothetical protein
MDYLDSVRDTKEKDSNESADQGGETASLFVP